jgi:hypothetical protein
MFKDERTNGYDEERSGRPFVVSDDLVRSERWPITISELSYKFMQISRTLLYEIITVWAITSFALDGCRKCSRVYTNRREYLWIV